MRKNVFWLILTICAFMGFNITAKADTRPQTIQTGGLTTLSQYVSGLTVYLKTTSDWSKYLYCENSGLSYPKYSTMSLNGSVDKGFNYIINNMPSTGDSNENYYIVQVAVWWYVDYLNGNNSNLSSTIKTYITNNRYSDTVCYYIYNLVTGAKSYTESSSVTMYFDNDSISFTESNGYYVSETISFTSSGLSSVDSLQLSNAPYGAAIINNTISSSTHTGTFQVRVPINSISEDETVSFSVTTTGYYTLNTAYDYYYGSGYQKVIYGQLYGTSYPVTASKTLTITRDDEEEYNNSLIIKKVNDSGDYLSGATLKLYSGNCTGTTCSSGNLYASWLTDGSSEILYNVPVGTYTLVETSAPSGYEIASKMKLTVSDTTGRYTYTMVDYAEETQDESVVVKFMKTDITGSTELAGATLVVKNSSGNVVASWVSTTSEKYLTMDPGVYTLTETDAPDGYVLNTSTITFMVSNGYFYQLNSNGTYSKVSVIKMVNEAQEETIKNTVNITKLDSDTNAYVSGASLLIKDTAGNTIVAWTTTNETYYAALESGEYILTEEAAPDGYELNSTPIYFKVSDDGTIMVKNASGDYETTDGIIMYDTQKGEEVVVPKTGASSMTTYITGFVVLVAGAYLLIKNGKKC